MAKGEKCIINTCTNIISQGRKGFICGTCQYRKRTFNSYDLPNHVGEPSYPVKPNLPEGIAKICKKHGHLTKDECYLQGKHKNSLYQYWYCKKCILDLNIKNKYGLEHGLEDYEAMLSAQNGICAICKCTINNTTRNGKIKRFNIDHDHSTGLNRKILCSACNSGLGYFKDSIETLQSAIHYLKSHRE